MYTPILRTTVYEGNIMSSRILKVYLEGETRLLSSNRVRSLPCSRCALEQDTYTMDLKLFSVTYPL